MLQQLPNSTSSDVIESLAALCDSSIAIQTRLHRLTVELSSPGSRSNFFKDSEFEKIRKLFEKGFPKRENAMKETSAWKSFGDKAPQILLELANGYDTMKELGRLQEGSLIILKKSVSFLLYPPNLVVNIDHLLTSGQIAFMDLVSYYAKILLQINKILGEVKMIVNAYNSAFFCVNGRDDDSFIAISDLLMKYFGGSDSVLRVCSNDLSENGTNFIISEVIFQILDRVSWVFVTRATNTPANQNLSNSVWLANSLPVFQNSEDVTLGTVPSDLAYCLPVILREKMKAWVIYCLLACPFALASMTQKKSLELLLRKILSENVVETLFRQDTVRVHDLFHETFDWFPSKMNDKDASSSEYKKKFKEVFTMKPVKLVSDASIDATNKAALIHRERRNIIAQSLHSNYVKLQSCPGLIAPTLASLISLLSSSREEIYWYFNHTPGVCAPPKVQGLGMMASVTGSDAKYVKDDWFDGARVGTMLFVHMTLYSFMCRYWWMVNKYAVEMIQKCPMFTGDLKSCDGNYYSFLTSTEFYKEEGVEDAVSPQKNELLFRLKLLSLKLESNLFKGTFTSTSAINPLQTLIRVMFYANLIEPAATRRLELDESQAPLFLKQNASLCHLIFYSREEIIDRCFLDTLENHPRQVLGLVDALSTTVDALNPYCPEENKTVGDWTTQWCDLMLQKIQAYLDASLHALFLEFSRFNHQINPVRAAERLQKKDSKKNPVPIHSTSGLSPTSAAAALAAGGGGAANAAIPGATGASGTAGGGGGLEKNIYNVKPGMESLPINRKLLSALRKAKQVVRSLCAGLSNREPFLVWDRIYVLREYLRESITTWLEKSALKYFYANNVLERPSIVLRNLLTAFEVCRFACEHAGLDEAHIEKLVAIRVLLSSGEGGGGVVATNVGGGAASIKRTLSSNAFSAGSLSSGVDVTSAWFVFFMENILQFSAFDRKEKHHDIVYSNFAKGFVRNVITGTSTGGGSSATSAGGGVGANPNHLGGGGSSNSNLGAGDVPALASPISSGGGGAGGSSSSLNLASGGAMGGNIPDFDCEMNFDPKEMQSLVVLVGAKGVRAIENRLTSLVLLPHCQTIKAALSPGSEFEAFLSQQHKSFHVDSIGLFKACTYLPGKQLQSLQQQANIVYVSLRAIGCCLVLLQMMRDAVDRQVSSLEGSDLLFESLQALNAYVEAKPGSFYRRKKTPMSELTFMKFPYVSLFVLLDSVLPSNVMNLLPLAVTCSLILCPEHWKYADYSSKLDGHLNNAHLLGFGLMRLIEITSMMRGGEEGVAQEQSLVSSFISVYGEIKKLESDKSEKYRDYPLRSILLFVELFVEFKHEESGKSKLREFFNANYPYKLVKQARIDLLWNKTRANDNFAPLNFGTGSNANMNLLNVSQFAHFILGGNTGGNESEKKDDDA